MSDLTALARLQMIAKADLMWRAAARAASR